MEDWGSIYRAARLGFEVQADGGDRFRAAWHASADASTVGAAAMGGAACVAPLPHRGVTVDRGRGKQGEKGEMGKG
jgi:hypothetical protein